MTAAAALTMGALFASQAANSQTPAGDPVRGKVLFVKYTCYGCHGYSGQNGPGARLVPMKMAQVSFTSYVRSPKSMPAFSGKVITDEQLGDIWAYIKTLPDAPDIKDIPLMQEILKQK